MRKAKYIEKTVVFNEDNLDRIFNLHFCSRNIMFFVQKYVVGRAVSAKDRDIILRQYQVYRILKDLKQRNKV